MLKKNLPYIVIILGILIIFSFIALIYGIYLKTSVNSKNLNFDLKKISLNLNADEEIINIDVIDNNRLLIVIKNSSSLKGAIYNIKQNKISKFIEK
tara:strand:- start:899 stop:1186 length:288 start_codon:yes stop_codon:yes gene_type:complete